MTKTIAIRAGVAVIIWLLLAVVALASVNMLSVNNGGHVNSPSYYSAAVSTLGNSNINDSINCVEKRWPGWSTVKSRTFNSGKVTDVVRADTVGEINCHNTGINNGAHQSGVDPATLDGPTDWGPKNDHGT